MAAGKVFHIRFSNSSILNITYDRENKKGKNKAITLELTFSHDCDDLARMPPSIDDLMARIERDGKLQNRLRAVLGFPIDNSKSPALEARKKSNASKVSFETTIDLYARLGGSDKEGDGSKSNPFKSLEKAWNFAQEKSWKTSSKIVVHANYSGLRMYASSEASDIDNSSARNADLISQKVAGMEFVDEVEDEDGHPKYIFRIQSCATLKLRRLSSIIKKEVKDLRLNPYTTWHYDATSKVNLVEILCPDQTIEAFDEEGFSPRSKDRKKNAAALAPVSGEVLYDHLLNLGIGLAVGKVYISEMMSYVHDGGGGIFTLGGKKASIEFDALIRGVTQQGRFSLYYASMVFAAAVLAGFGLVYNNTVVIVASMLVSPLMGPILTVTFGMVLQDPKMTFNGLWTEMAGLALCVVIGFIIGCISLYEADDQNWPNPEMESRGIPMNLIAGVAIAIPSGIGVATSLTDVKGSTAGLIGVAISAALLPPAVNCGLLWAYGAFGPIYYSANDWHIQNSYVFKLGGVSLGLTIMNILCIWLVAWLTYRFFRVGKVKNQQQFYDLIHMRKMMNQVKDNQNVMEEDRLEALLRKMQSKMSTRGGTLNTFRLDTFRPSNDTLRGFGELRQPKEKDTKRQSDRKLPQHWTDGWVGGGDLAEPATRTPKMRRIRSRKMDRRSGRKSAAGQSVAIELGAPPVK